MWKLIVASTIVVGILHTLQLYKLRQQLYFILSARRDEERRVLDEESLYGDDNTCFVEALTWRQVLLLFIIEAICDGAACVGVVQLIGPRFYLWALPPSSIEAYNAALWVSVCSMLRDTTSVHVQLVGRRRAGSWRLLLRDTFADWSQEHKYLIAVRAYALAFTFAKELLLWQTLHIAMRYFFGLTRVIPSVPLHYACTFMLAALCGALVSLWPWDLLALFGELPMPLLLPPVSRPTQHRFASPINVLMNRANCEASCVVDAYATLSACVRPVRGLTSTARTGTA
jgi:hypothetical protein